MDSGTAVEPLDRPAVRFGPRNIHRVKVVDENGDVQIVRRFKYTQAKNEHLNPIKIDVPVHPDLDATIAASEVGHLDYLVTEYGKPHTPNGFGNWFADRCREAGVPGRAHGLRKALLTRLASRGATPHEIMAWSGHLTLEEAELYTREADKVGNADAGLVKLTAGKK